MFRKNFYLSLVIAFAFCSIPVLAQDVSISGKVMLKNGEGTIAPLSGVTVGCYALTDFTTEGAETSCGEAKTDAEGKFAITGLQADAKYILVVNGETIAPSLTLPVKSGATDRVLNVTPGDGAKLSRLEVWQSYAKSDGGTGDQKKALELYEKEIASLEANAEKVKASNAKRAHLLKEGTAAFNAKDYDLAIAKFEEGYSSSPNYVGSAPVFLNNKAATLRGRVEKIYNPAARTKSAAAKDLEAALQSGDNAAIATAAAAFNSAEAVFNTASENAGKDLAEMLNVANISYQLIKNATATDTTNGEKHKKNLLEAVSKGVDAIGIMVQIGLVDPDKSDAAKQITAGYLNTQKDRVKNGKAQSAFASYMMASGDYAAAAGEFRKALEYSDKDPDALAGLGLSLYTVSFDSNDKAQRQESLNYMSYFLKIAPKNHKMRSGIVGAVDDLIKNQKLKPQKIK